MSETVELLMGLLDAEAELEQLLGDEWPALRDELADLVGRLDAEGENVVLRRQVDNYFGRLLVRPASRQVAQDVMARVQSENENDSPTRGPTRFGEGREIREVKESDATQSATVDGCIVVPVFYGTDRAFRNDTDPRRCYLGERGALGFGVARVSIPASSAHDIGELESPHWWRLEFQPDVHKHVVLLDLRPLGRDSFVDELRASLASADERDVLVFVHGYTVGFADAARRAAQVAVDLKFKGRTALYSWPSAGAALKYTIDEASVEWSVPHFQEFLRLVLADVGARAVHVIAHSMGNRALVRGLERFDIAMLPPGSATLRQIVFAAPDIDRDTFLELARAFSGQAQRFTLYTSSDDIPLKLSKLLHRYPRAGDAGSGLVIVEGVDTIDASRADTSLVSLRHSYFGNKRSILHDIHNLIVRGDPPDRRFDLEPAFSTLGRYWLYRT
jgi:esterase/lipase superfamily enzyme